MKLMTTSGNSYRTRRRSMPQRLSHEWEGARKRAIDEAYAIATQSRPDTAYGAWVCPTIELVPVAMGTVSVPIYRVVVELSKKPALFASGGRRRFEFQLDAASGEMVGLQDGGWAAY